MKTLSEIFKEKYNFIISSSLNLIPGDYVVKNFWIFDNAVFTKTLYLDTDKGYYKTVSRNLIGSLYGGMGEILKECFNNNESIKVEIINQKSKSGKYGLAFYLG